MSKSEHTQDKWSGSICETCKENENLEGYPDPDCKECDGTGRTKWTIKTDLDNNTLIGIEGAIPEIIAELPEYNPNSKANAKRIVQAVNSFEGLLKACKSMKYHFKYAINDAKDEIAYQQLIEAIAQVEGEED